MGRDGQFLTPKAIAKRLKAKGLGRQWLYCQMCRKQCRDQNGFKCHTESEQHLRNMEIFAERGEQIIEDFSQKFENKFMEYMRRSYRSVGVPANVVYNQIIRERNHVRMNGTKWAELSEFVQHLVKTGKCKIEETEKGPHLRYVEDTDDPEIQFQKGLKRKKAAGEAAEIDRQEREIQLQIERARREVDSASASASAAPDGADEQETDLQGSDPPPPSRNEDAKVAFSFAKKKKARVSLPPLPPSAAAAAGFLSTTPSSHRWLCEGIVVKIVGKKLRDLYKQKGTVKRLLEQRRAEIELLDSGEVVRVDEGDLETVIPQIGRLVRIVNRGSYGGADAKLVSCDTGKFCVSVEICSGAHSGTLVSDLPYEDVCKVDNP